jgi:hypothetical protein
MRLPDSTHRIAIFGRTGSGKTQAAAYFLSRANFDVMPWIILDFKKDALLNSLRAKELKINASIPTKPGLYITHPMIQTDDEAVESLLWRIWRRGNTGVYIDEGYALGNDNAAFRALLTQGRSKHIPMMVLSQRPLFLDRFVFSEADFYLAFSLNDRKDQQRAGEFMHRDIDLSAELPKYHAHYHDVGEHSHNILRPVPSAASIRSAIKSRLGIGQRTYL